MNYIGILDGSGDVWGVRVPDVAGCFGGGPTAYAAVLDAIETLQSLRADNQVPDAKPRSIDEIMASGIEFDPSTEIYVMLPIGD